jgi:hypothetical protein
MRARLLAVSETLRVRECFKLRAPREVASTLENSRLRHPRRPIFVTEWGATKADGGVGGSAVCATEADDWHDWMDANQIGWTAWKLDDCDTEKPADTSCLLKVNAPLSGGWDALLNGHGPYVVDKLKN